MTNIHTRVFQELSEFFDEPLEHTMWKCNQWEGRVFRQWKLWNPQTEEERRRYYELNSSHLYETASWHSRDTAPEQRYGIGSLAVGKVLDYGCGIGTEGLYSAELGREVHFYDLGIIAQFMNYRLKKSGLPNVKMLFNESDFDHDYDCVICIDVLEHLDNPMEKLELFAEILKPDGLLIIDAPFNEINIDLHLDKHKDLNLEDMIYSVGIKRCVTRALRDYPNLKLKTIKGNKIV